MKLTSKGRYAVTAILDVAIHSENTKPVSLAEISRRQDISLSYLEQLFSKLRKKELVVSTRGPGGGYILNHPPEKISVAMIVDAVDESVEARRCNGLGSCREGSRCLTHSLWGDLSAQITKFLDNITLQSLMAKRDVQYIANKQEKYKNTLNGDNKR